MPSVENEPGRRRAQPNAPETSRDLHARARSRLGDRGQAGDEQSPTPRIGHWSSRALGSMWGLALVALAIGLATLRTIEKPTLVQQSLAAALGVVLAVGLSARIGAHVLLGATLALIVGVGAVLTQWPPLLGGAAFGTGVLAACLGVLATRPAMTFRGVVFEVVVALLVATVGGLGVVGFSVGIDTERFAYGVLSLAFLATVAMVYRLGGGLYGLGGRGLILGAGALALLVVVLVYTAALTRYGSPELVLRVDAAQDWTREYLGGVPHPVEVLVGIPALAWGVSMRARRRQGWWVCAFGTAATAHVVSDLLGGGTALSSTLAALYGLVLGLLLGFAVIRLERVLTGRSSRAEKDVVQREEPGRMRPLH